jgi:hypothetical protein
VLDIAGCKRLLAAAAPINSDSRRLRSVRVLFLNRSGY